MCGIAGSIGICKSVAIDATHQMLISMRHRGPDGEGLETIHGGNETHPVVLAHTRLAVVDPSPSGKQPMANYCANEGHCIWITFNGEIYNFRELRKELQKLGFLAATGTDTEVVLLAYRAWGVDAINRFRGMFAFALADTKHERIWLARDRLGIKPLYFTRPPEGGLLFASEVKTLLAAGPELVPHRLARPAVESFFAQGAVYGLDSHIHNVITLGPGESMVLDWAGKTSYTRKYWNLPFTADNLPVTRPNAVCKLRKVLHEAVRLHLLADVPAGIFLSGGVDSTAIATFATEVDVGPISTISIGFNRPEYDETTRAAEIAKRLGTEHRKVMISEADICADFDLVLRSMDQPTVDGFNTFYVSRAAASLGIKVALSGLGGDELFGGYASFRDVPRARRLSRVLAALPASAIVLKHLSTIFGSRGFYKLSEATKRRSSAVQMYLLRRELFLPNERRTLWSLPDESDAFTGLTQQTMEELSTESSGLDSGNTISALEITGYMRNMLLRDADVFSMAHGLELRVPFLDDDVVATTAPLAGRWKVPGPPSKPLLLDAVGPRLPQQVGKYCKRGFTFPWSEWFHGKLANSAAERLHAPSVWKAIGVDANAPKNLWERFQHNDPAVGGLQILSLVVLADVVARQGLTA